MGRPVMMNSKTRREPSISAVVTYAEGVRVEGDFAHGRCTRVPMVETRRLVSSLNGLRVGVVPALW